MLNNSIMYPRSVQKSISKCLKSAPHPCWKVKLDLSGSWMRFHLARHSAWCELLLGTEAWDPSSKLRLQLSVPSSHRHLQFIFSWMVHSISSASAVFSSLFVPEGSSAVNISGILPQRTNQKSSLFLTTFLGRVEKNILGSPSWFLCQNNLVNITPLARSYLVEQTSTLCPLVA